MATPSIGAEVVARYPELSPNLRAAAQSLLASRSAWTKQLLQAVDAGKIAKDIDSAGSCAQVAAAPR